MKKLITVLLFYCVGALAQAPPTAVAISNAKIVTISGATITKGTVVVRDGLIEAVGDNITPPADALIIDGAGLTVYPGLIDALSTVGIPATATPTRGGRGAGAAATTAAAPPAPHSNGPEDRPMTTSWIKAADEIQPADHRIEIARNDGFTTAVVFPTVGIFAGQGSIIDLAGVKTENMVLVPAVGQYISMRTNTNGFPSALMGVISYVRQTYMDAAYYKLSKEVYANDPRGMKRPEYNRALEGVLESKRILLPAERLVEMDRMLRFAAELKQPVILYGLHEGYRAADLLKKNDAVVLVSLKWPEKPRDTDPDDEDSLRVLEERKKAPSTPAVLQKAGVKFAFYTDGVEAPRDLQRAVKAAIDQGLSREEAVRAFTLSPAEIYGVADRLGSIEKGKIANLLVTRGELFDERTKVEMVFVDGVKHVPAPEPAGRGTATETAGDRGNQ
jgi:imidazolonepropionase-like amidohydrolase